MLILRLFFAMIFLFLSNIVVAQYYALSYDNVPISAKTWEEIDITWPNPFNLNIPNKAKLLRPIEYAKQHGLVLHGHVKMNLSEFGVPNANVIVAAVKPLAALSKTISGAKPVIGFFVHQTNNVRTYRFKNNKRNTSIIHATPNHPFYVKNLNAYIRIDHVTEKMELEGKRGQLVHIICPRFKAQHCGIPYKKGQITTVYNLEIYRQHVYRIGDRKILVHNAYNSIDVSKNAHEIYGQLNRGEFLRLRQNGYGNDLRKFFGHDILLGRHYDDSFVKMDVVTTGHITLERASIIPAEIMSDPSNENIDLINRFMDFRQVKLIGRKTLSREFANSIIEDGVSTAPRSVWTLNLSEESRIKEQIYPSAGHEFAWTGNNCRGYCEQIIPNGNEPHYKNSFLYPSLREPN